MLGTMLLPEHCRLPWANRVWVRGEPEVAAPGRSCAAVAVIRSGRSAIPPRRVSCELATWHEGPHTAPIRRSLLWRRGWWLCFCWADRPAE